MRNDSSKTVRIAAVGDLHIRTTPSDLLASELATLNGRVDVLVVAGDITESGRTIEIEAAADLLSVVRAPMVGVLGNHDRRGLRRTMMRRTFAAAGLELLDGDAVVHEFDGRFRIGFAGVSGTGGGFRLDEDEPAISNRLRQVVAIKARREALRLKTALATLHDAEPDVTISLTHFAPTVSTLGDEPILKHWMLGNSLLGQTIDDDGRVDLSIHGHAHLGNLRGETPGGVPVRNVALPVTGGIVVFEVGPDRKVRAVNTGAGPSEIRTSETSRLRMLDFLRNE